MVHLGGYGAVADKSENKDKTLIMQADNDNEIYLLYRDGLVIRTEKSEREFPVKDILSVRIIERGLALKMKNGITLKLTMVHLGGNGAVADKSENNDKTLIMQADNDNEIYLLYRDGLVIRTEKSEREFPVKDILSARTFERGLALKMKSGITLKLTMQGIDEADEWLNTINIMLWSKK